jgi:hypothetical protein
MSRCEHCGHDQDVDLPPTTLELILASLDTLLDTTTSLSDRMDKLMDAQQHLNDDVTAFLDGLGALETEVSDLKAQSSSTGLDFTGLDSAVARMRDDVSAAAPAQPATGAANGAPVVAPAGPASSTDAPAAGSVAGVVPAQTTGDTPTAGSVAGVTPAASTGTSTTPTAS